MEADERIRYVAHRNKIMNNFKYDAVDNCISIRAVNDGGFVGEEIIIEVNKELGCKISTFSPSLLQNEELFRAIMLLEEDCVDRVDDVLDYLEQFGILSIND